VRNTTSEKPAKPPKPRGIDLPFWRSMPRPLLVVFLILALGGLVLTVLLVAKPPRTRIATAERRSPPSGTMSHDPGELVPAPLPTPLPSTSAPCDAVAGVVIEGGPPAQVRLGGVLERLCSLLDGPADVVESVKALSGAHIRFARFARTGDPSTLVLTERRIYVNVVFARRDVSASYIMPILAHEGWHLAHLGEARTALQEVRARSVELAVCRRLLDVRRWPRGCTDAANLLALGEAGAVTKLVEAGYSGGK
jgi:hypothetical protein